MDAECLGYWRVIIDNLMTHDKTTFKDLLGQCNECSAFHDISKVVGFFSAFDFVSTTENEFVQPEHLGRLV